MGKKKKGNDSPIAQAYKAFGIDVDKKGNFDKKSLKKNAENMPKGMNIFKEASKDPTFGLKSGQSFSPGKGLAVVGYKTIQTRKQGGRESNFASTRIPIYGPVGAAPTSEDSSGTSSQDQAPADVYGDGGDFEPLPDLGGYSDFQDVGEMESAKVQPPTLLAPGQSSSIKDSAVKLRKRKSSARESGKTSLGTGQLRIGDSASSSGSYTSPSSSSLVRNTGLNTGLSIGSSMRTPWVTSSGLSVGR